MAQLAMIHLSYEKESIVLPINRSHGIEVVDHVSLLCDGAISAVVYMDYEQVSTVCRYNAQWCKMLCNEHQHCVHRLFVAGNTMVLLNY
jgi:hypothetical protein